MDTGVTVTGIGTAAAPPDVMHLELAAEAEASGVQDALGQASAALERMRRALLDQGVDAADTGSGPIGINPRYDQNSRVYGYVAELRLRVMLRDLATAGPVLSAAVTAGGDAARVYGMSLEHSDPVELLRRAREAAWKDAHARAVQYARLAGRELGDLVAVTESSDGSQPVPRTAFLAGFSGEAVASVPVEPGTSTVTVRVTARWELR
ncbi:DUF541 domain-containing protein [Carbonactinospora thermoautotrophica]|uniref:LpqG n=1 Tax=Carbonactinospora thermoautotrophica TaxID=1469144 RepID=A0A132MUU1_9ACTN|nr:SIMPL domain-containing protein [Carbonactinospora thermoautotrophica]KWX01621.1 LpqG [Carbonactinospora thermoautotrophica]MCX9190793.1 DUF541 domain-containing protein [Carbonactinospora thermoautotrophica]